MKDACTFLALLGFLPDDLGRQLLEITQHRRRELEHLDLALELRLESLERNGVLGVEVGEAVRPGRRRGMVERPLQVDGERLVRFLVEPELVHRPRLVPAWVVVEGRGIVETELHVVMRTDPFTRVDDAALERGVDLTAWGQNRRAARPGVDLAAEAGTNTHLEPFVVADRGDLFPEPSGHLWGIS